MNKTCKKTKYDQCNLDVETRKDSTLTIIGRLVKRKEWEFQGQNTVRVGFLGKDTESKNQEHVKTCKSKLPSMSIRKPM